MLWDILSPNLLFKSIPILLMVGFVIMYGFIVILGVILQLINVDDLEDEFEKENDKP